MCLLLAACGGGSDSAPPPATGSGAIALSAAAQLGQKIFNDATLSVSGTQSCASCHVTGSAFAEDASASGVDHGSPVPIGGAGMNQTGFRNTPSLMYASLIPAFTIDADGGPNGGFFRDGRANTLADQAVLPFTTSFEMGNADASAVIARLKTRPYLADFQALYGSAVLDDPATALARMGQALAAFETEEPSFHPFSSKYDAFQNGQVQLSAQELRGLALFNNATKGNCSACHPSTSGDGVHPPMFTDFSYDNLGIPRNGLIPANAASAPAGTPVDSDDGIQAYYDLGVCGPFREQTVNFFSNCGQFKVPTLRNIAVTAPYFHNGRFTTLKDAIGFYVRRDTNPEEWYPMNADGTVTKFDDLPAIYGGQFVVTPGVVGSDAGYLGNVNTSEIPYNRSIGDTPALSPDEIDDVITFLCTLTDGYDPAHPGAQVLPAQCQAAVHATAAFPTSQSR
ncbi:cytochrome-c peroxidase [Scleromatobacter humisilvae]|uniref:C-type cytochrome n=1 Tax=Scleromatobacter humisilvae TaxID=2897159 RepID=A0A9X1YGG2_9BURK|nr:cytochrome c peroxidase [Scleromatobacter humisilvae]MCK9685272.1 c-type cytochrome [Scleromatobacter humisilvae]